MIISDRAALALRAACGSRGKRKGQLLASAPPSNTDARAAWQGAMLVCNPYKASIAARLFMTPEHRAIAEEITRLFDWMASVGAKPQLMDKDRAALELLGVW